MVCLSIDALTWRKIEECCEIINHGNAARQEIFTGTVFVESLLLAYYKSGGISQLDLDIQPRECGRYRQVYLDMGSSVEQMLKSRSEELHIPLEKLVLGVINTYTGGAVLKS